MPRRAQGLNNALMDAGEVVDAVVEVVSGDMGLEEAVGRFEGEMIPRGRRELGLSYDAARGRLMG